MYGWNTKYYAEFKNTRGQEFTIYVDQRGYSGAVKKIGDFCGCVLEVQGGMESIITPIVKTQLRFSMVDSSDKTDTQTTKYGDWQEFFTPDATLYIVSLVTIENNVVTHIWDGYITPDSWKEDLDYRGIITITARDGLGHLKDFTFEPTGSVAPDDNGLIPASSIIGNAMSLIEVPMLIDICSGSVHPQSVAPIPVTADGEPLVHAMVNASLFEGMNWYDILEQTLEAIGYVCRYTGAGGILFAPLRDLPKLADIPGDADTQTMEFYGGTLELDPAVKKIVDTSDYKMKETLEEDKKAGLNFTGSKREYTWKYGSSSGQGWDYQISNTGTNGWQSGYGFLRGSDYYLTAKLRKNEGEDAATAWPLLVANQSNPTTFQTFRIPCVSPNVKLHIVFGTPLEGKGLTMQILELGISKTYLSSLSLRIMFVAGGVTYYWDGEDWDTSSHVLNFTPADRILTDYPVDIPLGDAETGTGSYLLIEFRDIQFIGNDRPDQGIYARIKSITTEISGAALEKNTVTTVNNQDYNVMLERRPLFGALSREMSIFRPSNYEAGLFYYTSSNPGTPPSLFPYQVKFNDQSDTVPLPVLIHQQILCYYYGAARILSGNCAPVNKAAFDFGKICVYKGHKYILQGGTLDYFSGIMTGAILREYMDFEDLWDGVTPTYDEDVKYDD